MTDLETDDTLTICAISVLAAMLADVLHEGVGHAALALVTGAPSGVLTTVAWSSTFDSKLVAAGGTLVNLVAGGAFWFGLRAGSDHHIKARGYLGVADEPGCWPRVMDTRPLIYVRPIGTAPTEALDGVTGWQQPNVAVGCGRPSE